MVSCELFGRTGNTAFQIATTIALAHRNKVDYMIPEFTLNPQIWAMHFSFPRKRFRQTLVYKEPSFDYQPIPYQDGICLSGYWQSEKYFIDFKKEVFDSLKFRWEPQDYVSIHVRRGDYVTKFATKHPPVTVEYIRAAMEHFPSGTKFIFFSDDIQWCMANFPKHEFSMGETPVQAMQAMINAKSCITANSSLSVFAAMMNQNPEKMVICPKIFYGPGNAKLESKDRIPEEWIRI